MKIIEAMKKIKVLLIKLEDIRVLINKHAADMSFEEPVYKDQYERVKGWLQARHDMLAEIEDLRIQIQHTNMVTPVTIVLGDKKVTKPIAAWIHRRRDLARHELDGHAALTDRNLKDGFLPNSQPGQPGTQVKVRRYFDPMERDRMIQALKAEPIEIDAALEIANATTDLIA